MTDITYCYCDSKQHVHRSFLCLHSFLALLYISIHRYFMCVQSWNSESSLASDYIFYIQACAATEAPPLKPHLALETSEKLAYSERCVM